MVNDSYGAICLFEQGAFFEGILHIATINWRWMEEEYFLFDERGWSGVKNTKTTAAKQK